MALTRYHKEYYLIVEDKVNNILFRKWKLYYNNLWIPHTLLDIYFIEYINTYLLDLNIYKEDNETINFYNNEDLWFILVNDNLLIEKATIFTNISYKEFRYFIKIFLKCYYKDLLI